MSVLLVFTNLPDRASAEALAEKQIEARRAACGSILAPCRSVYRWQGAEHSEAEVREDHGRGILREAAIRAHPERKILAVQS
jgi:periplasmic divalent cation tolerance protein